MYVIQGNELIAPEWISSAILFEPANNAAVYVSIC